jgi:hypothetical protein
VAIDVTRAQEELQAQEDLSAYAGQWVALRDGHVVAAAPDPTSLRENPDVREDDELVPVGEPRATYFL